MPNGRGDLYPRCSRGARGLFTTLGTNKTQCGPFGLLITEQWVFGWSIEMTE